MAKTVEFLNNKYQLYIMPEARRKMELYCDLSEGEIGWLAFVDDLGENGFLITDCALLHQEVHSTTTEITPEGLLKFWDSLEPEDQCRVKCWGHSHVNMSPTPSGQDNSQMEYFKDGNPWFIRLITNKKREYHIDIFDYENGIKVHMDQADLITYTQDADLRQTIMEEIKEKVSKKEYKSTAVSTKVKKPVYSSYSHKKSTPSKETSPLLVGIEVKYVSNFDDVLNDPNYWQDILD